jgi:hypothetical protein
LINSVAQARSDVRRFENERRAKDSDELRALLDETAVKFEQARLSVRRLSRLLAGTQPGGEPEIEAQMARLVIDGQELTPLRSRITIRLGESHEVPQECEAALEALRELVLLLEGWVRKRPSQIPWRQMASVEEKYVAARDRYVEAAREVAGSLL